eukprot:432604_1
MGNKQTKKQQLNQPSIINNNKHKNQTHTKDANKPLKLLHLISTVRDLANHSGSIIRNVFESGNLHIIDKSKKSNNELYGTEALNALDPQTIADCAVQKLIITSLLKTFPGITVIGEEDDDNKSISIDSIKPSKQLPPIYYNNIATKTFFIDEKYDSIFNQKLDPKHVCIWVDPIDGTKEYTQGIKNSVTCLIGIAYKGQPISGVINRPFNNQIFFGVVGVPCIFIEKTKDIKHSNDIFNVDNEILIDSVNVLTECELKKRDINRRIICCSRSFLDETTIKYINNCNPDKIERRGGAGGKVLMVLEGEADSYVCIAGYTKKWDMCAPQALLQCVGGALTEPNGKLLNYTRNARYSNSNGIVATWSKKIHSTFCVN